MSLPVTLIVLMCITHFITYVLARLLYMENNYLHTKQYITHALAHLYTCIQFIMLLVPLCIFGLVYYFDLNTIRDVGTRLLIPSCCHAL